MHKALRRRQGKLQANEKLDFTSINFDPLLALNTPGLQPPNPRVRPLDNVSQAIQLLPPDQQAALGRRVPPNSAQQKPKAPERKDYKALKEAREDAAKSVLQQIVSHIREGPLLLLKQCYEQRSRVRVVTRHAHGVRGVATGTLWAFDKHMNMVLRNVHEEYTVRLWVPRDRKVGAVPPVTGSERPQAKRDAAQTRLSNEGGAHQELGSGRTGMAARDAEAAAACGTTHRDGDRSIDGQTDRSCSVASENSKECRVRLRPVQEHRSRQLKQVYLRGANVVLLSVCTPEQGSRQQHNAQHAETHAGRNADA